MNKRKVSFIYRVLVIVSLFSGITLNLLHTISIVSLLSYYTLQINVMCLVAFITFCIADILKKEYRKSDLYYVLKGTLVIAMLIMAITYQIALVPNQFQMDSLQSSINNKYIANLLVHKVSPILVILDYFIFDEKGRFRVYYPIIWLFFPLNYVVYVYVYRASGGRFYNIGGSKDFAYFFLDYKQMGYIQVLEWIIMISIGILILGILLFCIDKGLARFKRKNNERKNC